MKQSDLPTRVPLPWAALADPSYINTIPLASQIGVTPGLASLTTGFVPLNFTPLASGGSPPKGADLNGILNLISQTTRWSNAGSLFPYDSTFAVQVGGYPKGSRIQASDGVSVWVSTADDNTTNPDAVDVHITASSADDGSGAILTVTVTDGIIGIGQLVTGTSMPAGTYLTAQISGTAGGTGTYSLNQNTGTVGSESMTVESSNWATEATVIDGLIVVADAAEARALNNAAIRTIIITSSDGGQFFRVPTDTTTPEDGGTYCGTILHTLDSATNGVFQRNYSGYVLPAMFGCAGDGTTDDTTTLQNCLNAAPSAKKPVLMSGSYKITSTLTLSSYLDIQGIKGKAVITFSGSMTTSNVMTGTSLSNIKIDGLEIVGDTSANASGINYGCGINLVDCNDVEITDNYVHGFVQAGIVIATTQLGGSARGKIVGNRVDSISSIGTTLVSGIHGIRLADVVSDWEVANNEVTNTGTAANNTGGIGIVVIQENLGWTTPDNIRIRNNLVSHTCQHGIAMYASSLAQGEYHPMSVIEGNIVQHTGEATLAGGGGAANSLGNGIYCEQLVPGAIDDNVTYDTHVAAVSSTIADAAIAVMVNTASNILNATLSITGNSCFNCHRSGIRVQRVSGVSIDSIAKVVSQHCLQLDGVQNFTVKGTFSDDGLNTTSGIAWGTAGVGGAANGCKNGVIDVTVSGFTIGASIGTATNIRGTIQVTGYSAEGALFDTVTNCYVDILADGTSVPAFVSANTSTTSHVTLKAPNRALYFAPYVSNAGTGVIVETWSDSAAPTQGTWAVGDMVRYRVPTAATADYARCVTAGTPGTWKAGAVLAA